MRRLLAGIIALQFGGNRDLEASRHRIELLPERTLERRGCPKRIKPPGDRRVGGHRCHAVHRLARRQRPRAARRHRLRSHALHRSARGVRGGRLRTLAEPRLRGSARRGDARRALDECVRAGCRRGGQPAALLRGRAPAADGAAAPPGGAAGEPELCRPEGRHRPGPLGGGRQRPARPGRAGGARDPLARTARRADPRRGARYAGRADRPARAAPVPRPLEAGGGPPPCRW